MTEWLSYNLSDFLPFSERVYLRQLELTNEAVWPAHLLAVATGLALAVFLYAPTPLRSRLSALLLGLAWFLTGWFFIWERYAEINWLGVHISALFALQGAGLSVVALSKNGLKINQKKTWKRTGLAILVLLITVAYPTLNVLVGRSVKSAEVFAVSPDPTALVTICILTAATIPGRVTFFVLPVLWCIFSVLTHATMGSYHAWTVMLSLLSIVTLASIRKAA